MALHAGDAQPEGVHSMVSVIDIQLVLQHMFSQKVEADIVTAIRAVSTDSHVTIAALMPMQRWVLFKALSATSKHGYPASPMFNSKMPAVLQSV